MQTVEFSERLTNILTTLQIKEILWLLDLILHKQPLNVAVAFSTISQQAAQAGQASPVLALPATETIKSSFPKIVFQTKANLHSLSVDPFNREIISSLGLNQVFEAQPLGEMITAVNSCPDTHAIRQNTHFYHIFCELFSALSNLQRFQLTIGKFLIQPNITSIAEGEAALEFEIIDVGNRGIDMERLEAILKSIHSLHDKALGHF
jgi:hypothetical protein